MAASATSSTRSFSLRSVWHVGIFLVSTLVVAFVGVNFDWLVRLEYIDAVFKGFGLDRLHQPYVWLQLNVLATIFYAGYQYCIATSDELIRIFGFFGLLCFYFAALILQSPIGHLEVSAALTFGLFLVDAILSKRLSGAGPKTSRQAAYLISLPTFIGLCILIVVLHRNPMWLAPALSNGVPSQSYEEGAAIFVAGAASVSLFVANCAFTMLQIPLIQSRI